MLPTGMENAKRARLMKGRKRRFVEVLEQELKVRTPMLMLSLGSSLVSYYMNVTEGC